MLELQNDQDQLLGSYSLYGGTFDLRYERPTWVLRTRAWLDTAPMYEGYNGPIIVGSTGTMRPIYVPLNIVFGEAKLTLTQEVFGKTQLVSLGELDDETKEEYILPITKRLEALGFPAPSSIDLAPMHEESLSYQALIEQLEDQNPTIEDAHNHGENQFHICLGTKSPIHVNISYQYARSYLGS